MPKFVRSKFKEKNPLSASQPECLCRLEMGLKVALRRGLDRQEETQELMGGVGIYGFAPKSTTRSNGDPWPGKRTVGIDAPPVEGMLDSIETSGLNNLLSGRLGLCGCTYRALTGH